VRLPAGWQCGSDRPGAFKGLRPVVLIIDMQSRGNVRRLGEGIKCMSREEK